MSQKQNRRGNPALQNQAAPTAKSSGNSIVASWRRNSVATRILRAFLGFTWAYAGFQKATDAGFLNKASANYIGTQLAGFTKNSPISWLLQRMIEHAQLVGWMIMFAELIIGIAILLGVAMQAAALGGAAVSAVLWLSASWTVYPYFLGSDSAYLVLWLVLFFLLRAQVVNGRREKLVPDLTDRRDILQMGLVAVLGLIGIGAGSLAQKKPAGSTNTSNPSSSKSGSNQVTGTVIVKTSKFPVGSQMQFTANDGNPAYLFRTATGVYAYSALCTHQGCVVGYTASTGHLDCPCHGGSFDPANGAQVVAGPPPAPLPSYKVAIQGDSIVAL